MRVLGIDPGYGRCGFAVLEKQNGKEILIHSECVETSAATDFPLRLTEIASRAAQLIETHRPECVALEKLFITKNQKTAMRVSEARGALIEAATRQGLPVFEYTPGEVKSAVSGFGRADKQQIAKMLHALVQIEKEIEHDDEYDAIAIAIAHFALRKRT